MADVSKALTARWQMACRFLLTVIKNDPQWVWPLAYRGKIHRELRRVHLKIGVLSPDLVEKTLLLLWTDTVVGGESLARAFIQQVELALTNSPDALVEYLSRAPQLGIKRAEVLPLFFLSLPHAADEVVRNKLQDEIERLIGSDLKKRQPVQSSSRPERIFTRAQHGCFHRLVEMGELFFDGSARGELSIQPRLSPLIVGPTGTGKSYLVHEVARELGATFVKVAPGDWVPFGANADQPPTIVAMLDRVMASDRVVFFFDELDKWLTDANSSWSRSCVTDLWQMLDRNPPFGLYLSSAKSCAGNATEDEIRQRLRERAWFVGAGTWQHLHSASEQLGFSKRRTDDDGFRRSVVESRVLPEELLYRFNPEIVLLRYPEASETQELYQRTGLAALAAKLNYSLDPARHDWRRGGMRTLEDLATQLLIRARAAQKTIQP